MASALVLVIFRTQSDKSDKSDLSDSSQLVTRRPVDLLTRWLVDFAHRARVGAEKFTVLRRMEGRDTVAECFELLFNGVIRVIKLDVKRETLTPYD